MVTLLGSLPSSFSTVVTALEARADAELTLDFVQQQLVHHEHKLNSQETKSEAQQDLALVGAQKRKPSKCWACDEVGHIRRIRPKLKGKSVQHGANKVPEDEVESDNDGKGAFRVSDRRLSREVVGRFRCI